MRRRTFLARTAQAAVGFHVLRGLGACAPRGHGPFILLRDRYVKGFLERNPVTSTYLGGDGLDPTLAAVNGRLRDWTPGGITADLAFAREIRAGLEAIAPDTLGAAERLDREVMLAQTGYVVHMLDEVRYHQKSVESYNAEPFRGVDWQLQGMADAGEGRLGTPEEWSRVVERVRAIPAYLDVARANLEAGRRDGNLPDRRMLDRDGVRAALANADYFGATLPATAAGYLGGRDFAPATLGALREAGTAAAAAWRRFAAFLSTTFNLAESTDRFAVGEREYAWRLTHCLRETRTAAELFDYGAAQTTFYQDRMFRVAEEVARGAGLALRFGTADERRASVRAVMDHLSGDAPRDDAELFRWYRQAGERAVAYGRAHGLFAIPEAYRLDVVETPPVLRGSTDAAYYPAPPFKQTGAGRFYLTPTGNDPAALRLNNRASVADTAVHEGFPGHDWHYKYMSSRAREIPAVRWLTPGAVEDGFSMWADSMASEGWALYAEDLMAEPVAGNPHGFFTAAEHLYELQGQLLRAVRVHVDVAIHTGRRTFDEAVDWFAANVEFLPDARARAARDPQARAVLDGASRALYRYSKWPTQAITYNLGKRAIEELRDAVRRKEGAGFDARVFHERFMAMGTIPTRMFREAFLEEST